jgi:hypothetical protein
MREFFRLQWQKVIKLLPNLEFAVSVLWLVDVVGRFCWTRFPDIG